MNPSPRFYPRARDAFGAFLDAAASDGPRRTVLLPAYVGWSSREGSGVFDPVRERGLRAAFYRMTPGLTVDVPHLAALLAKSGPAVLVAIHYFGRPDPALRRMAALARRHGALVLEDAAHAYFSARCAKSCGTLGDAAIYSVHKMFPVEEGGLLAVNAPWLEAAFPARAAGKAPSWARFLRADPAPLAAARARRYAALAKGLRVLRPALVPLWRSLPEGTVPQTFPLRVATNALRDKLYFGLKERGYAVASLYHTMIPELRAKDFPASFDLAGRVFNLPLDAGMTPPRVRGLLKAIAELVRG